MSRVRFLVTTAALIAAALSASAPAQAKLHLAELGLTPVSATCDSGRKGTYLYKATWRSTGPTTVYTVHTGNQCKVGTSVCGTALSTGCRATCDAKGRCSTPLNACIATAAAAGQWVKVLGSDGGWQQVPAASPGKCQ